MSYGGRGLALMPNFHDDFMINAYGGRGLASYLPMEAVV